jgi:hypothetical protein
VGGLLYCCMTKATIAEDDHYPASAVVERGTHAGFTNKRPPRATVIRHLHQRKGGNSRGVCEQEIAEGDYYPALAPAERGAHGGFANKRPPRATIIRHFR